MLQHFRIDSKWRRGRSRRLHTQCTDEKKQAWECKIKNGEKGKYEINKCSNNTLIDTVVLFRNLKSIFRYTGNILADKTNECGATAEDVKCWRTIYATILRFFFFQLSFCMHCLVDWCQVEAPPLVLPMTTAVSGNSTERRYSFRNYCDSVIILSAVSMAYR